MPNFHIRILIWLGKTFLQSTLNRSYRAALPFHGTCSKRHFFPLKPNQLTKIEVLFKGALVVLCFRTRCFSSMHGHMKIELLIKHECKVWEFVLLNVQGQIWMHSKGEKNNTFFEGLNSEMIMKRAATSRMHILRPLLKTWQRLFNILYRCFSRKTNPAIREYTTWRCNSSFWWALSRWLDRNRWSKPKKKCSKC